MRVCSMRVCSTWLKCACCRRACVRRCTSPRWERTACARCHAVADAQSHRAGYARGVAGVAGGAAAPTLPLRRCCAAAAAPCRCRRVPLPPPRLALRRACSAVRCPALLVVPAAFTVVGHRSVSPPPRKDENLNLSLVPVKSKGGGGKRVQTSANSKKRLPKKKRLAVKGRDDTQKKKRLAVTNGRACR